MKKIQIEKDKLGDVLYWENLFKTPENDFKKLKKQTKNDLLKEAYTNAPDSIRLNKEWVLTAVKNYYLNFYNIEESIKDKQYCIRYIEEHKHPYVFGIPEQYQAELFEKIVLKNEYNIKDLWYSKNLQNLRTKENICKWVALNPNIYKEIEKTEYKNDFEIAEIAVKKDCTLLLKMNKSIARKIIARNLNIALEYFEKESSIFPMLPLKLRNDKDFILKHINKMGYSNVPYVGKEALMYKEVLLNMKSFYEVIIPENHLIDKDVMYHILKQQNYVSSNFKDCDNFTVVSLIKEHLIEKKYIHFYKNLPKEYKENPEIISCFLEIGHFEDVRIIKKLDRWGYEFEDRECFNSSVVNLLSEDIQKQLKKEYNEIAETKRDPDEWEMLSFARSKYLQKNLIDKLDEKIKVKRLKI